LDLGDNALTGPLPTELGLLTNVADLAAGGQCLSGTVPTELGAMASLTNIDMPDACLVGPVPWELGELVVTTGPNGPIGGLVNLDLSGNTLTGSIPLTCAALTLLTNWDVEDNVAMDSCSPLPEAVTTLTNTAIGGVCPCMTSILTSAVYEACEAQHATCTDLDLSGLALSCTIPTEIGLLTALTNLNLGDNALTGPLPTELGLLTNVKDLAAGDLGCLSGTVPTELGAMASLTNIDMPNACLVGPVPSELGALIVSVPPPPAGLSPSALTKFASLNPPIGGLVNLDLSGNTLTGSIPMECAELTLLTNWDVKDNVAMDECSPLPEAVTTLTNTAIGGVCPCMTSIKLSSAYVACVAAPAACTDLDLSSLSLSCTIPTEIGLLTALTNLDLGDNDLTGPLPTELGLLTNVVDLVADGAGCLSGTVPTELGAMASLTNIDMPDACLVGPVPSELGALRATTGGGGLVNLDLSGNVLTGSIPIECADLTLLTNWDVEDNVAMDSCSPLPATVTTLTNTAIGALCPCMTSIKTSPVYEACVQTPATCTDLDLSGLSLSCTIPTEIGLLTALTNLDLGDNALTGPLPTELGLLTNVVDLVAGDVGCLSGTVPTELGAMASLTNIDMENACLVGPVPSELGALVITTGPNGPIGGLINLDLSGNELTSSIPMECSVLTLLTKWDVEDNVAMDSCNPLAPTVTTVITNTTIDGPCPCMWTSINYSPAYTTCMAAPPACTDLDLSSLSLECTIPTEIGLLTALTNLDFGGGNNLTGGLPTELGLLTNVKDLVAGDQCLGGTVPTELGAMASLTNIDMENACLVGPVPSELGALVETTVAGSPTGGLLNLDLSGNELTSSIPMECAALTLLTMWDVEDNIAMENCSPLADTVVTVFTNTFIYGPCPADPCETRDLADQPEWIECMLNPPNCTHLDLSGGSTRSDDPAAGTANHIAWCAFTGTIPTEVGLLTGLTFFSIEQNHIDGTIPSEFGLLTDLTTLNIGENDLDGPVPPEIGDLEDLQELVIQCNDLSGALPAELAQLDALTRLDASCNVNVCGCVPGDLAYDMSYNSYEAYDFTNFGHDCGDALVERPKECRTINPAGRVCAARWEGQGTSSPPSVPGTAPATAANDNDGVDDWMYIHPRTLLPWVRCPCHLPLPCCALYVHRTPHACGSLVHHACGTALTGRAGGAQSCEGIVTHFPSLVPPVNRSMELLGHAQPGLADWLLSGGTLDNATGGILSAMSVDDDENECDENAAAATLFVAPPLSAMMDADGSNSTMEPDDACAQVASAQGQGDDNSWTAARFTAQEFPCQQAAVAQAVTAAVGPDQQVMTGVRTQSGGCMATQATGGQLVWAEVACAQGLPTICRADNPSAASVQLNADGSVAHGQVVGGATQALFLAACAAATVLVGAAAYKAKQRAVGAVADQQNEKNHLMGPDATRRNYSTLADDTQVDVFHHRAGASENYYTEV
jgi:Leucine-rich repeat (LRR) protein